MYLPTVLSLLSAVIIFMENTYLNELLETFVLYFFFNVGWNGLESLVPNKIEVIFSVYHILRNDIHLNLIRNLLERENDTRYFMDLKLSEV